MKRYELQYSKEALKQRQHRRRPATTRLFGGLAEASRGGIIRMGKPDKNGWIELDNDNIDIIFLVLSHGDMFQRTPFLLSGPV